MAVRFQTYLTEILPNMTKERAERVRVLRCESGHTYKGVAQLIHESWGPHATWPKEGCPTAGEAICVAACRVLKEVPYKSPWA